jgi:hypothetical protein
LAKRVKTPFQLSTDGFPAYESEVFYAFLDTVHFGQVVKQFANPKEHEFTERKYSPSVCVGTKK